MVREVPIKIWRRTNDPAVVWRFKGTDGAPAPLSDRYTLTVDVPGRADPIVHTSDEAALAVDDAAGTVTWSYTLAESEGLPLGTGARYELMGTTAGRTRLWAGGRVVAESWRS